MTIKTKNTIVERQEVIAIICDRCGREDNLNDTSLEYQEYHQIYFTGGYGSIFGDGETIQCDLCQHCLMELIKPYYRSF